jgi:hypothetical protein
MKLSTGRWAVASFVGGIATIGVAALPVVAVCAGAGGDSFRRAFVTVAAVVVASLLVVIVALDLFEERPRRGPFPG